MADESNQGRGFARMSESKRKHVVKTGGGQDKQNSQPAFTQEREKTAIGGKAGGPK